MDETPAPQPPARDPWARAFTVVAIAALLVFAGLYVFNSLRSLPGDAVDKTREVLEDLSTLAAAFSRGNVETTFVSYAARVTGSNYLQFSTLRQVEVYTRTDEASVLWGTLELPEIVVSATAPVEYTYYLDLDEQWSFRLEDRVLHVNAPAIRFNKPAIDASEIRYEVRSSSLLRDEEMALVKLKQALTTMSEARAKEHIPLVRELGRQKTREFVENWLVQSFGDGSDYEVRVTFADEAPARGLRIPTERVP